MLFFQQKKKISNLAVIKVWISFKIFFSLFCIKTNIFEKRLDQKKKEKSPTNQWNYAFNESELSLKQ
jgi:hypothetical protein